MSARGKKAAAEHAEEACGVVLCEDPKTGEVIVKPRGDRAHCAMPER